MSHRKVLDLVETGDLAASDLLEVLRPVILQGDAEVQLDVQESLRGAVGICIRDRTEGMHPNVHVLRRCAEMMSDKTASAKTHVLADVMATGYRPAGEPVENAPC